MRFDPSTTRVLVGVAVLVGTSAVAAGCGSGGSSARPEAASAADTGRAGVATGGRAVPVTGEPSAAELARLRGQEENEEFEHPAPADQDDPDDTPARRRDRPVSAAASPGRRSIRPPTRSPEASAATRSPTLSRGASTRSSSGCCSTPTCRATSRTPGGCSSSASRRTCRTRFLRARSGSSHRRTSGFSRATGSTTPESRRRTGTSS